MISENILNILKLCRCSDISDAMDSMCLREMYVMDPGIRPLIPRTRFCGIAVTIEYDRTDVKVPYLSWEEFCKTPYGKPREFDELDHPELTREFNAVMTPVESGRVVVCSCHGLSGAVFGSENCMKMMLHGVVGVVLDGHMRDTDECIRERIPAFSRSISCVHPLSRLELKTTQQPIVCGDVRVCGGDVICADNDGVICVPQRYADEIARRAYRILQLDRIDRRADYEALGRAPDETVELLPDLDWNL